MFTGIEKEDFFTVNDDDAADGAAAAAPVVLPTLFEKPNQDTASYMGCSNDPVCRRQGRNHLKAFCVICNERGHRNCMVDVDDNEVHIFLRDNQDPEKEAGKAVRELKLDAMMCNICDKHYGWFNRMYFKISLMLRTLKPKEELEDDDAESDSSKSFKHCRKCCNESRWINCNEEAEEADD
jgi:hypothetical protein